MYVCVVPHRFKWFINKFSVLKVWEIYSWRSTVRIWYKQTKNNYLQTAINVNTVRKGVTILLFSGVLSSRPSTHQWPVGSVWGSLAASDQRRWRNPEQRGSGKSWGRQTAGWTVPLLWSYRKVCRTVLLRQGQAGRQTEHWIYPQAPATTSWQPHTESHVCCPPGRPNRNKTDLPEWKMTIKSSLVLTCSPLTLTVSTSTG